MRGLALIVLGTALAVGSPVYAEKVKTTQATKLYSHPGEHGAVLLKVKSGQNMTVIGHEGRWLKVRVQGHTGFIPRSKVDMPDDDEIVRNTRRRPFVDGRSTKRGFGGGDQGPDDRVGGDATGDVASSAASDDTGDDDDPPKKASPKLKADKPRQKAKDQGDEDDDDKPKAKAKHKGDDDDDKPKAKAKPKDDDDDKPKAKAKPKDDDDDDDDKPKAKAKHTDDDEPDDSKTGEPSDDDNRPRAHVSEKTEVLAERDKESDTQFVAKPGDVLYPEEAKGKWTFVSNDDGDAGWLLTSSLEDDGGGGSRSKRTFDVRLRTGLTFIQQGMRSTGSTIMGQGFNPDNYNLGTSALTLSLAGSYYRPYGKDYLIGGEASYTYAKTVFGGVFADVDGPGGMPGVNIGLALHQVDLRLAFGKDFHRPSGLALFARLGYRYQGFLIDNVNSATANPAKLPSEVLQAPTVGAMLQIPRLTDKLGLRVAADAVVAGASLTQTKGLEDGKSPSAKMYCLGAVVTYAWKKGWDLQGSYELDLTSIDFGAPVAGNLRGHTGTDVSRSDNFSIVTAGLVHPM
jgi:hypothetical protein